MKRKAHYTKTFAQARNFSTIVYKNHGPPTSFLPRKDAGEDEEGGSLRYLRFNLFLVRLSRVPQRPGTVLCPPMRRVSALVIGQRFDALHPSGDVGKSLRKRE